MIAPSKFLPVGYFTSHPRIIISKNDFLSDLNQAIQGEMIAPIAVVDDEKYADLAIFWAQDTLEFPPELRYQESNRKGFVCSDREISEIKEAIEKRSTSAVFIRYQLIPSLARGASKKNR